MTSGVTSGPEHGMQIPRPGLFCTVRNRRGVVAGVEPFDGEPDVGGSLRPGMFVARVVGRSMEPRIPDGSLCLFQAPVAGSRQGRVVLVELRDAVDPESGQRYTVKRYDSEKAGAADGAWRHVSVTLSPLNPEYEPIVVTVDDEADIQVVAEVLEVLAKDVE